MIRNSTTKAILITTLFAIFGIVGLLKDDLVWFPSFVVLYVLLLAHTFLSIRCFSALIDPRDKSQLVIDLILVLCYLAVGLSIKTSTFMIWWVALFLFATLKYALLVGRLHYPNLLRRKLVADVSGSCFGFLVLFSPLLISWVLPEWLIITSFTVPSVYYFFIRPLYVPDKMSPL